MTRSAAADDAAIWAVSRSLYESFAARHEDGIESALEPQCTVWDVFEPQLIRGVAEREAFHARDRRQSMARGKLSWSFVPLQLDRYDDFAIARYYLDFDYAPPNPAAGRVRVTDVLRLREGAWRIVHHHEGLSPGGPPPIGP